MASSIGTNVVADENELFDFIKKIEDVWGKVLQDKKHDKYKKMIENIGAYVGNGGSVVFTVVPKQYVKEIEERLRKEKIDYMLLPTEDGVSVAVKDCDKEKFYEIQDVVLSMSTEYYAELTDTSKFITYCKDNANMKGLDIPVLEFSSNEARLIMQNKMNQQGILPIYDDRNQKVYVLPNKLFSENGDLCDSLFAASIDYARCSMSEEYLKIKQDQIVYDRNIVNELIDRAKSGKEGHLVDYYGNSDYQIDVNVVGDIYVTKNGIKKELINHNDLEKYDRTAIFSMLQKYAVNINDMVMINYEDHIKQIQKAVTDDRDVANDRDPKYDLLSKDNPDAKTRPTHMTKKSKALSDMGMDLDNIIMSVKTRVNEELKDKNLSQKELLKLKKNLMQKYILAGNSTLIQDFLNKSFGVEEYDKAFKKQLLQKIVDSVDDVLGNNSMETKITYAKQKELEEELNRASEFEYDKENDYEQEYENDYNNQ